VNLRRVDWLSAPIVFVLPNVLVSRIESISFDNARHFREFAP